MVIINASDWQSTHHHHCTQYYSGAATVPNHSFDDAINPKSWQQRYGAYAHIFMNNSNGTINIISFWSLDIQADEVICLHANNECAPLFKFGVAPTPKPCSMTPEDAHPGSVMPMQRAACVT